MAQTRNLKCMYSGSLRDAKEYASSFLSSKVDSQKTEDASRRPQRGQLRSCQRLTSLWLMILCIVGGPNLSIADKMPPDEMGATLDFFKNLCQVIPDDADGK